MNTSLENRKQSRVSWYLMICILTSVYSYTFIYIFIYLFIYIYIYIHVFIYVYFKWNILSFNYNVYHNISCPLPSINDKLSEIYNRHERIDTLQLQNNVDNSWSRIISHRKPSYNMFWKFHHSSYCRIFYLFRIKQETMVI